MARLEGYSIECEKPQSAASLGYAISTIILAAACVGYRTAVLDILLVLGVISILYLALMHLAFKSQP